MLMEAFLWERLTEGKLGLVLMGGAMLSKSLTQFSLGAVFPPCYLPGPNYREGTQPHTSAENWIKDLLNMILPTKVRPTASPSR